MSVPPACAKIADDLNDFKVGKKLLQEDLKTAAPGEKSAIVTQIKQLSVQINKKQLELNSCITKNS
jgi:hypothetical protein